MASLADIESGANAIKARVYALAGWKANFLPWSDYEAGSRIVLGTFDQGKAVADCGQALYDTIAKAGYGSQVNVEQCTDVAQHCLETVGRIKP